MIRRRTCSLLQFTARRRRTRTRVRTTRRSAEATYSECKSYASHLSKSSVGFADASQSRALSASLMTPGGMLASARRQRLLQPARTHRPREPATATTVVSQCSCRRLYKVTDTGCAAHLPPGSLDLPHLVSERTHGLALLPPPTEFLELTYGGEMLGNGVYRDGRAILLDGYRPRTASGGAETDSQERG